MVAEISDGKLVNISGDKSNPDSRGFLCVRGQAAGEIIGNDQRLLNPLIREKRGEDAWRKAGWDETLNLIASRMQEAGPSGVGFWPGHGNGTNDYAVGNQIQCLVPACFAPGVFTAFLSDQWVEQPLIVTDDLTGCLTTHAEKSSAVRVALVA
jgi:anaerobic selenocysteine-containing dehydrogenase